MKKYSDVFVYTLLPVIMMALPLMHGMTTSRLVIIPFIVIMIFWFNYGRLSVNRDYLIVLIVYSFLIVTLFSEFLVDTNLVLQLLAAYMFLLVLLLSDKDKTTIVYLIPVCLFVMLGILNFEHLLLMPFNGMSRIDILYWQKDTSFFFGINRFLLALFVLISVLLAAGKGRSLYTYILAFSYVSYAVLLGSRVHTALSMLFIFMIIFRALRDNRLAGIMYLSMIIIFVYAYNDIIQYMFDVNVLERILKDSSNPLDSPRGMIYSTTLTCAGENNYLYGNDIAECFRGRLTNDFDSTVLFVFGAGGIISLLIFFWLLIINVILLFRSNIPVIEICYIFFGYIMLINTDVVIFKAFFFLPLLVYIVSWKRDDSEKSVFNKPIKISYKV